MVSICGYHLIEVIYDGSRTLVYRGIREADGKPVVIKLLKNPYPNFNELVQFRNQYNIAKNLSYPRIIWTLDKKICSRVTLANKLTRHDKLPQLFS